VQIRREERGRRLRGVDELCSTRQEIGHRVGLSGQDAEAAEEDDRSGHRTPPRRLVGAVHTDGTMDGEDDARNRLMTNQRARRLRRMWRAPASQTPPTDLQLARV